MRNALNTMSLLLKKRGVATTKTRSIAYPRGADRATARPASAVSRSWIAVRGLGRNAVPGSG